MLTIFYLNVNEGKRVVTSHSSTWAAPSRTLLPNIFKVGPVSVFCSVDVFLMNVSGAYFLWIVYFKIKVNLHLWDRQSELRSQLLSQVINIVKTFCELLLQEVSWIHLLGNIVVIFQCRSNRQNDVASGLKAERFVWFICSFLGENKWSLWSAGVGYLERTTLCSTPLWRTDCVCWWSWTTICWRRSAITAATGDRYNKLLCRQVQLSLWFCWAQKNKHDSSRPWKSLQYFAYLRLIPGDVWQPGGLPVQGSGGLAGD